MGGRADEREEVREGARLQVKKGQERAAMRGGEEGY